MTELPAAIPSIRPDAVLVDESIHGGILFAFRCNDAWVGYTVTTDDARAVRDTITNKLEPFGTDSDL
jgi:hypothetical protein